MVNSIKEKILSKKELQSIDEEIFKKIFEEEKKKNANLYKKVEEKQFNEKSKEYKEFVKIIRKRLREIYGVFFKDVLSEEKRKKLLMQGDDASINRILSSHLSTYERKNNYKELYEWIFSITGTPKKILDLGCGYNPFSYFKLGCTPFYIASDISRKNLEFINQFFKSKSIPGATKPIDTTTTEGLEKIKKITETCEVTFCFKLLDSLEAQTKGASKQLLNNIKSNFVIVSFPQGSISGKNKIKSQRKWFQDIIKDVETENKTIGNEKYYILKHKNSQE